MKTVYLDTSAIVKRYIQEAGSDVVTQLYSKAWLEDLKIAYSAWNIGEVLGVLDKYYMRRWLSRGDYELARLEFLGETMKMLKLKVLRVVPVKLASHSLGVLLARGDRGHHLAFVDYSSVIFVIILAALILGKELTLRKIITAILVFSALVLLAL